MFKSPLAVVVAVFSVALFPIIAFAQEVVADVDAEPSIIGWLTGNYGALAGIVVAFVLLFDRIAKLTPTDADNKIVRMAYKLFAVLGLKVPDIK